MVEPHQCAQTQHLRLLGDETGNGIDQSEGVVAQRGPEDIVTGRGRVALVEDQIDDSQHRFETVRQFVLFGDAIGDTGVSDLFLGPDDSLRDRRFPGEESPCNLGG